MGLSSYLLDWAGIGATVSLLSGGPGAVDLWCQLPQVGRQRLGTHLSVFLGGRPPAGGQLYPSVRVSEDTRMGHIRVVLAAPMVAEAGGSRGMWEGAGHSGTARSGSRQKGRAVLLACAMETAFSRRRQTQGGKGLPTSSCYPRGTAPHSHQCDKPAPCLAVLSQEGDVTS